VVVSVVTVALTAASTAAMVLCSAPPLAQWSSASFVDCWWCNFTFLQVHVRVCRCPGWDRL